MQVILPMSRAKDFVTTINEHKVTIKLSTIICGSHKSLYCAGLETTAFRSCRESTFLTPRPTVQSQFLRYICLICDNCLQFFSFDTL